MANKSMFDDELILPGVITEIINDYVAGYDTSEFGSTDAVTVIGTAFNGPVGIPVPVFSPEYAKYMFGEAFDPVTRREASLVPEIYDAWNTGCRTIYAVRLSGKDMYKDYELAIESDFMLRVSGQFPCNENKRCYMLYDAAQGDNEVGNIRIFKPADRTTVQEKLQGVVNNINSILTIDIKLAQNGFTKGTRLIELIDYINGAENNNVITLSIVDRQGNVITEANKEVQKLNIGDMFPGIYTLCRDENGEALDPRTNIDVIRNSKAKLYPSFKDAIWKKLIINTDVKQPYPIHAENFVHFKNAIEPGVMAVDSDFEFLKKLGAMDKLAVMNDADYEEVDLDPFELYMKLGKGFVKNAKLEKTVKNGNVRYKVVQPGEDDPNRIVGINDGIYSILENHKSDYLVLAGVSAETVIDNNLPRKDAFKVVQPNTIKLVDKDGVDVINAECKVDANDNSRMVNYEINIKDLEVLPKDLQAKFDQDFILNNISDQKFIRLAVMDKEEMDKEFDDIKPDQVVLVMTDEVNELGMKGQLARFNKKEKKFVMIDFDLFGIGEEGESGYIAPHLLVQIRNSLKIFVHQGAGMYQSAENNVANAAFIVATNGAVSNVYFVPEAAGDEESVSLYNALRDADAAIQMDSDGCILTYKLDTTSITPLISLKDLAEGKLLEDEYTVAVVEEGLPVMKCAISDNETFVGVYSNEIQFCSQEEMVDIMNKHSILKSKFKFDVADAVQSLEELPKELIGQGSNKDENAIYDETMYIPYTTTDNFARHLAQHCLYTQLKTYPTHGVIGCSKLSGVNLTTIANRVDEVCAMDFDLYAKKDNGNYMLDSDNQPYPLGRCVSIPFLQYRVGTGSSYNYLSNGAAGYAGMVSNLPAERSSTNQPIDINELGFELSNFQLGRLNTKGIVCAKTATNGNIVIVDGITQAPKTSAYRRLATSKTINIVDRVLRQTIEPYIGLVDSLSTRNSLNTAIKSALQGLVDVIINDFKFKISTDAAEGALGIIRIDYVIVPCNEIREVRNRVEISDAI